MSGVQPTPPIEPATPATPPVTPPGTSPEAAPGAGMENLTSDQLKARLSEANAEAATRRHQNKLLQEENQRFKDDKAAAEQKILAEQGNFKTLYENQKAENQAKVITLQDRAIMSEIRAEVIRQGGTDEDISRLIDRVGVKVLDNGEIVGVKEAVALHKTIKPAWYQPPVPPVAPPGTGAPATRPTGAPGAAPNPSGSTSGKNVKDMTAAEYRAWKSDSVAALRRG